MKTNDKTPQNALLGTNFNLFSSDNSIQVGQKFINITSKIKTEGVEALSETFHPIYFIHICVGLVSLKYHMSSIYNVNFLLFITNLRSLEQKSQYMLELHFFKLHIINEMLLLYILSPKYID